MVLDAGYSVGASWSNYISAGKWLSAHSPDAAILDVKLQDRFCIALVKKLTAREIPFLAVSGCSAIRLGSIGFSGLPLGWKSPSPPPDCSWHCAAYFNAGTVWDAPSSSRAKTPRQADGRYLQRLAATNLPFPVFPRNIKIARSCPVRPPRLLFDPIAGPYHFRHSACKITRQEHQDERSKRF
jgi:hypothetical protein